MMALDFFRLDKGSSCGAVYAPNWMQSPALAEDPEEKSSSGKLAGPILEVLTKFALQQLPS
jgi:hypothetical protein